MSGLESDVRTYLVGVTTLIIDYCYGITLVKDRTIEDWGVIYDYLTGLIALLGMYLDFYGYFFSSTFSYETFYTIFWTGTISVYISI